MKAELEEIIQAEADVTNLKKKVDDLHAQLNQQCDERSGSKNDEVKDAEATSASQFGRSASKDSCVYGAETQELDSKHRGNSRPISSTNYKRSGARSEGLNSTTSALTRLTTRLNFLKERRSQITNELQNMDKGRGSEKYSVQNLEKDRQSLQDLDGGRNSEDQHLQSLERGKSDGNVSYNAGGGDVDYVLNNLFETGMSEEKLENLTGWQSCKVDICPCRDAQSPGTAVSS
ncbi:hypothetical protein OIU77_025417 [Salix suchowensis]|uniref:Uncharacterized protein n=1 Tax=Salix suchowensis TaxID=1278906 RepID=A0ABQ9BX04_9ROSI|nr:hypothetical protein OIU77_025417 [Salix suchowensis]